MIPEGGVGIFNGCDNILGDMRGDQFGGLLSDCEKEIGNSGNDEEIYTKRKQCLSKSCSSQFADKYQAKLGCLFLANFLEAAGYPMHIYKEVKCPSVLKDRY